MNKESKIFVAGHNGLSGSAIVRQLIKEGYTNIVVADKSVLDLKNQDAVMKWFLSERPEYVFLSAAKVGGIHANNTYPAEFIYDNLQIQNNVIHAAHLIGVKKLLFTGSICIYPKFAPEPVQEKSLLGGALEPSNEWYAIAKIAGIKMCQAYRKQYGDNFISAMPCNLYGINDNFHQTNSHVLPALIRRFHEAKRDGLDCLQCWGDGTPRREFLHADDLARALILLMREYNDNEIINVGYGSDHTIKEITHIIQNVTDYRGTVYWDTTRPNGTPKRLLDVSRIFAMGWRPEITLEEGVLSTYNWFKANYGTIRR
jgi:GDP-L-fucose synthase